MRETPAERGRREAIEDRERARKKAAWFAIDVKRKLRRRSKLDRNDWQSVERRKSPKRRKKR